MGGRLSVDEVWDTHVSDDVPVEHSRVKHDRGMTLPSCLLLRAAAFAAERTDPGPLCHAAVPHPQLLTPAEPPAESTVQHTSLSLLGSLVELARQTICSRIQ